MKDFDYSGHIDNIIDIIKSIELNKVTILTGDNATGKSMIRKTLWSHINRLLGIDTNSSLVSDISMERRTGLHPELGGMGVVLRDTAWNPTSMETYGFIKKILSSLDKEDNNDHLRYIVLDEPELGASREVQKAFAKYINKYYSKVHDITKCYGLLVITHSEEIVKTLKYDKFINIQGMSETEWLERDLKDVDLEEVYEFSNELFHAFEDRLKKVNNKKVN